jgi:hypothetical protein
VIAQIAAFLLTGRAISMTDLTNFGNNQMPLIELSFVARAVCDLITTAGIAWGLKMKRDSKIKEYVYPLSLPNLQFCYICHSTVTMVDRLIVWTIGKILGSASIG